MRAFIRILFFLLLMTSGLFAAETSPQWTEKGLYFKRTGQWDKALEAFSRAISNDPANPEIYKARARVWQAKGETDKAIENWSKALNLQPEAVFPYLERAALWMKNNQIKKAVLDYTTALEKDPGLDVALNKRGMAHYLLRAFDRSIADHTRAIELNPEVPVYYNNRGAAWFQKGNHARAIADYSMAVAMNRYLFNALKNRGVAWFSMGMHERAVKDFTRALTLKPGSLDALLFRGKAFYNHKNYDGALQDFIAGVKLAPDNVNALNLLALIRSTCPKAGCRDGKKALELARRALEVHPGANSFASLAAAMAEQGRFKEAEMKIGQAIALIKEGSATVPSQYLDMQQSYASAVPWRAKAFHFNPGQGGHKVARVRGKTGDIRSAPDTGALVIKTLAKGSELSLLGRDGQWHLVDLGGDHFGWVHERILTLQVAGALGKTQTRSSFLEVTAGVGRIRALPSTESPVAYRVKKGDRLKVIKEEKGWFLVFLGPGKKGWAHASLFTP